jgi:hypothetical protein
MVLKAVPGRRAQAGWGTLVELWGEKICRMCQGRLTHSSLVSFLLLQRILLKSNRAPITTITTNISSLLKLLQLAAAMLVTCQLTDFD